MPIDVKGSRVEDPIPSQILWLKRQTVVPFPQHGALSGIVDEDERLLAGAAVRREKVRFDSEANEFGAMQCGGRIIADFANVARSQPPRLTRHHRRSDLPSWQHTR